MNVLDYIKDNILILDGGMGTLLQARGLAAGEYPERWNVTHPETVREIHMAYFDAGSNVVSTNTFGANGLKFSDGELEEIVGAAIANVRAAISASKSTAQKFVALDIGPTGKLLKPYGDLDFEAAVGIFARVVQLGVKYGADLIFIETMNDSYETKAAVLAAKENSNLPVFVSNAYGSDGKLMTGATPDAMVAMLEGLGVDAIGANCSLGPRKLAPVVQRLLECASVPVLLKPNAGLPQMVDGKTVYSLAPDDFADEVCEAVSGGVRIAGGCCGTTPDYIRALSKRVCGKAPLPITPKSMTVVSSYTHAQSFGERPVLIGERINPTGKKRFKEALVQHDLGYILGEGIDQAQRGVHILDVNVGIPEIDEETLLCEVICELQAVTDLPLQIDTSNAHAMEKALRCYNGKAMINSVNGKKESMESIFPLVKKYGGVVVALTLDEDGIPETVEGRVAIAERILAVAAQYGIDKKDIIFDTLAMTVSADNNSALVTLGALKAINEKYGVHTSLGVSNVSFGLPERDIVNGAFFTLALQNGLSAAIMNPRSLEMMKAYHAYLCLSGMDESCAEYIRFASCIPKTGGELTVAAADAAKVDTLEDCIAHGLGQNAADITSELLKTEDAMTVVQERIIPALDSVGKGFEQKTVYLPQLLMSAEAAKSAFEQIKQFMSARSTEKISRCRVVLATVHGDIHDIGKNIVKLLLENYGFEVIDLGRDVPPEQVLDAVIKAGAPIVGLSALMTTTAPAMESTVALIKQKVPSCRIVVGGAVISQEYADKIGADFYAETAMDTVRFAQSI